MHDDDKSPWRCSPLNGPTLTCFCCYNRYFTWEQKHGTPGKRKTWELTACQYVKFRDGLLLAKDGEKNILSHDDILIIFNEVDTLVEVNSALLATLEPLVKTWQPYTSDIGQFFLEMVFKLKTLPSKPLGVLNSLLSVGFFAFLHGLY